MRDPHVTPGYCGSSPPGSAQPSAAAVSPLLLARQPLPKQLTAAIKSCISVEQLAQLTAEYQAVLNPIHIAAIITKLPKLDGAGGSSTDMGWLLPTAPAQQQQLRQLLQHLLSRLKAQGCKDHSPRGVSNIVWALAKLQCAPDAELHAMLLDQFCEQVGTAVPQDISNVMWGVAKLTKEHASVLSTAPGSTWQLPSGTAGGVTSSGSPVLQLGAGLQDSSSPTGLAAGTTAAKRAGPLLRQEQVRLLLQHLCKQLHAASVQTLSNSLWAVVVLQQEHQWCMCDCLPEVQTLLSVFCSQTQHAMPGHIQPIIRCMAQLATTCSSHAGNSWLQWQPPLLQRLLDFLASQQQQLEMHHVSSVLRDVAQIVCLHLQLQKHARDKQHGGDRTPTRYSSASSLPSMGEAGGLGSVEGTSPGLERSGLGCTSASSSTASSSSMLGPSPLSQSATASKATADDVEEVLARLASSGGPQDASSTVLALAMLRPQLQQLGLQSGVSALCSKLPPAALPHLGPDIGQRLLSAASQPEAAEGCSPTFAQLSGRASSGEESLDSPVLLPVSSTFAARVFAQSSEGLPVVPIPLAVPGSVSSSSSDSNVASPVGPLPLHRCIVVPPASVGVSQAAREGQLAGSSPTAAGRQPGSKSGSPPISANPGNLLNPGLHAGSLAAPAAMAAALVHGGEAEGGIDNQEEAAARQLTHNIAYADSVFQLADIFTAHASVMDMIHITACITRLSKVLGTSPSQASQAAAASLLPLLGNKLLSVLPHANARGIANVLWGYGRLRALPQVQLLPPLVEAFLKQLPNAACRDSAVVLWSLARLSEGHGEPAENNVPPELLRRLGREVLQQLATAAQDAPVHGASTHQQRPPGAPATAAGDPSKGDGHDDAAGPPSSRDVSNSLMALARLGFAPENDSASVAGAQQGAAALAGQMQGLSVAASGPAGLGSEGSKQLTLPMSLVKAVVEYLLRMSATAKTLDLQETATALKQLGLRELHAKVAATIVTHHGSAPPGSGGSMQFMQFGAQGSRLNYQGRPMGPQGPIYSGSQSSSMWQQHRQGMGSGAGYGGGGRWVPAHQQGPAQYEGGMMLRQAGPGGSYVAARQGPAGQVVRQPGMVQQQQQQGGYLMSASPAGVVQPGGRHSMPGYTTLAGASGGMQSMTYGGSPAAGPGAYAMQYGGEQQQQQQPPGLLQQQAGGAYSSGVQYVLMPQQVPQQGGAAYFMPQQGHQQQGGDSIPVLQQQMVAEVAPPGLVSGASGAASGGQQQYYLQASDSQGLMMPAMPVGQEASGGSNQQLFLQPAQVAAAPGLASMGQFGGAGVYQGSGAMLGADPMTSSAYNASMVGDMFLGGQAQQPQSARSQLQLLQQQVGHPAGLYQQQGQMQGFQVQDSAAMYLPQPTQQAQQQLPMMYGQAQLQQPQQQQFGAQQAGTFVLDPSTGLYHVQQ